MGVGGVGRKARVKSHPSGVEQVHFSSRKEITGFQSRVKCRGIVSGTTTFLAAHYYVIISTYFRIPLSSYLITARPAQVTY